MFKFYKRTPLDIKKYIMSKMPVSMLLKMAETDKLHWELAVFSLFSRRGSEACTAQLRMMEAFFYGNSFDDLKIGKRIDSFFHSFRYYTKGNLFHLFDNALRDPSGCTEHKIYCLNLMQYLVGDEQIKKNRTDESLKLIHKYKNLQKYFSCLIVNDKGKLIEELENKTIKLSEEILDIFRICPQDLGYFLFREFYQGGFYAQCVEKSLDSLLSNHSGLKAPKALQKYAKDIRVLFFADVNSKDFVQKIKYFTDHSSLEYSALAFELLSTRVVLKGFSENVLEEFFLPIITKKLIDYDDALRLRHAIACLAKISTQQRLSDELILNVFDLLQRKDVEPYFKDREDSGNFLFDCSSIFHSILFMFWFYPHHTTQRFSEEFESKLLDLAVDGNFHVSFHSVKLFLNNFRYEKPLPEKLFVALNNWLEEGKYPKEIFENNYPTDRDNINLAFSLLNKILLKQPLSESTVNKIERLLVNGNTWLVLKCQSILRKNNAIYEKSETVINTTLQLMDSKELNDIRQVLDLMYVKIDSLIQLYPERIFDFLVSCMKLKTSYGEEGYDIPKKAYNFLMKYSFDTAISDELLKLILLSFRRMHAMHEIKFSTDKSKFVVQILKNINNDRSISLEVIRDFQLIMKNSKGDIDHFSVMYLSIIGILLECLMHLKNKTVEANHLINDLSSDFLNLFKEEDNDDDDYFFEEERRTIILNIVLHLPTQFLPIHGERQNEEIALFGYIRETTETLRKAFQSCKNKSQIYSSDESVVNQMLIQNEELIETNDQDSDHDISNNNYLSRLTLFGVEKTRHIVRSVRESTCTLL